ncbi:hypothetical protein B0H13DRAFT_1862937 [Mycena leptocephala]|nr:hypothetical protein B0H13DRAFT_1862937 [Mycena leptocephala]
MTSGNALEWRKIGASIMRGPRLSMHVLGDMNHFHQLPFPPLPRRTPLHIKSANQQASIFLHQKLKAPKSAPASSTLSARAWWGDDDTSASAAGPFSAVSNPLRALRNAQPHRRPRDQLLRVLRPPEGARPREGCLLIVSELLRGDPATTLVNKHVSHLWSKITELSWTPPAPLIFAYPSRTSRALACHESGWLVVQHALENLEESAKDGIVDELLGQVGAVFSEVAKSQWGSYCIQHILEHVGESPPDSAGSPPHWPAQVRDERAREQECGEATQGGREGDARTRRAAHVRASKGRAALYDCIRVHIVTLRGCKTGSKAIWLFDRMRAYCGLQTYIRSFRFACMTDSNFDTLSFLVHSYSTSR